MCYKIIEIIKLIKHDDKLNECYLYFIYLRLSEVMNVLILQHIFFLFLKTLFEPVIMLRFLISEAFMKRK